MSVWFQALLVDPDATEDAAAAASLTMSYMPSFDEICGMVQTGELSPEAQEQAIRVCSQGCSTVHLVQEACLIDSAAQ